MSCTQTQSASATTPKTQFCVCVKNGRSEIDLSAGTASYQVGELDAEARHMRYAPEFPHSRRVAPGFHQKQGKRPKMFRRYAPEPCKWCKIKCFGALYICAGSHRETHHHSTTHQTRFPHTYEIYMCLTALFPRLGASATPESSNACTKRSQAFPTTRPYSLPGTGSSSDNPRALCCGFPAFGAQPRTTQSLDQLAWLARAFT